MNFSLNSRIQYDINLDVVITSDKVQFNVDDGYRDIRDQAELGVVQQTPPSES